ncbi:hypothetical protein BC830DRAFT_1081844 [Chytriomyces sp. MP71]|nr:hypothetical protein BC830DRAFT_1081844 [Chytriomyces sp. MP71]
MDAHTKAAANRNAQAQYRIRKQQRTAELESKVLALRQTLHSSGDRGRILLTQLTSRHQMVNSNVSDDSESDNCGRQLSSRKRKHHGNIKELPCSSEEIRQLPPDIRKVVQNRIAQRVSRIKRERRMTSLETELHELGRLVNLIQTEAKVVGAGAPSAQPPKGMHIVHPFPLLPIDPTLCPTNASVPRLVHCPASLLPSPNQVHPSIMVTIAEAEPSVKLKPLLSTSPETSPMHETKLPSLRSLGLPSLVHTDSWYLNATTNYPASI